MSSQPLPAYLASARPKTRAERRPWYLSTAPSYAGVFLWIVYYEAFGNALPLGGLAGALVGVALTALLSYGLFYLVFGLLGMQTGLPLYVVGSSTFGTRGGYFIPGVFMGVLQVGWFSVMTYYAARLILLSVGVQPLTPFDADPGLRGFSLPFLIVAGVWGYTFALVGALGVEYIAKVGQFLAVAPLAMLAITASNALPHAAAGVDHPAWMSAAAPPAWASALLIVQLAIGNFATAGTAGVDFGMSNRHRRDVVLGGAFGIVLPILIAGGLGLITVAGAHGIDASLPTFTFSSALPVVSPRLTPIMFLLFAASTIPSSGICAFIMGNSLSTMIPRLPRLAWTLGGATVGVALAVLGLAGNLESFFGLIGASFGPVAGAITADWLLAGRQWAGPRRGISLPGYVAWALGFLVGIANNDLIAGLLGRALLPAWHPTSVYSFGVGFGVYVLLAKAGLEAEAVPLPQAAGKGA